MVNTSPGSVYEWLGAQIERLGQGSSNLEPWSFWEADKLVEMLKAKKGERRSQMRIWKLEKLKNFMLYALNPSFKSSDLFNSPVSR